MNDIEVKAIEFIKFYKEHCLKQEQENMKNGNYEIVKDEQFVYKNLEIVLKLIENLLKERQSDKDRIKELEEEKEINKKITLFAENQMLGYMQGYEEGKKHKTTATAILAEQYKDYLIQEQIKRCFIPKSLIKEKIEELKNNPLKIYQNNKYYYETSSYNKIIIQVLEELLKGE